MRAAPRVITPREPRSNPPPRSSLLWPGASGRVGAPQPLAPLRLQQAISRRAGAHPARQRDVLRLRREDGVRRGKAEHEDPPLIERSLHAPQPDLLAPHIRLQGGRPQLPPQAGGGIAPRGQPPPGPGRPRRGEWANPSMIAAATRIEVRSSCSNSGSTARPARREGSATQGTATILLATQ